MKQTINNKIKEFDHNEFYQLLIETFIPYYSKDEKSIFESSGMLNGLKLLYEDGLKKLDGYLTALNGDVELQRELKENYPEIIKEFEQLYYVLIKLSEPNFIDRISKRLNNGFNVDEILYYIGSCQIKLDEIGIGKNIKLSNQNVVDNLEEIIILDQPIKENNRNTKEDPFYTKVMKYIDEMFSLNNKTKGGER